MTAAVSAVALTLILTGCWSAFDWDESSPALTDAEVIGEWTAEGPDGQKAAVVLSPNYFVQVTGMPHEVGRPSFTEMVDWSETFDGQANWQIRNEAGGASSVSVSGDFAFLMISVEDDDGQHLVVYIGDPYSRVRIFFDRVDGLPEELPDLDSNQEPID